MCLISGIIGAKPTPVPHPNAMNEAENAKETIENRGLVVCGGGFIECFESKANGLLRDIQVRRNSSTTRGTSEESP